MYISIMQPEVLPSVAMLGRGLWVVGKSEDPVLVIKAGKDFILTARERRRLKLYLAPYKLDAINGLTLLTACFDDPVSPLLIRTPLLGEDQLSVALKSLPNEFTICFFDENNRELLSCRAQGALDHLREQLNAITSIGAEHWQAMLEQADAWFGTTTAEDDMRAIDVELLEDLFPSDCYITDFTRQGFQGSPGYSNTQLERPEPGPLQELDIIYLLQRAYAAKRIIHGPLKVSDGEELVDTLILGDEVTVLLQAKDSPNTAATLDTTLERKRKKAISQLKGGLSQLRGALSTIRREGNPKLRLANGDALDINLAARPLVGVVIVRELFIDTYDEYGAMILEFMDDNDIPVLAFDYNQFEVMTRHCPSEARLLAAFYQIFDCARTRRIYPRLRFPELPPR